MNERAAAVFEWFRFQTCVASLMLLVLSSGCENSIVADDGPMDVYIDAAADAPLLRCPTEAEAPVPNGTSMEGVECIPVGPMAHAPANWPDPPPGMTFRAPVKYVSPTASSGGDGSSRERALPTVSAALALLGAGGGTVVLASGQHSIDQPIELSTSIAIEGVSASGGSDLLLSGTGLLRVQGTGVTLRNLAVLHPSTPGTPTSPDIQIASGAAARLEDLRVEGGGVGILVNGGSLDALRLTVTRTVSDGVMVSNRGRANLARAFIHHTSARGLVADGAVVHLRESLIYENAAVGVLFQGGAMTGLGASSCSLTGDPEGSGALQCVSKAAIVCNGIVGLGINGASLTAPGPTVEIRRVSVFGTRAVGMGGDGIFVGARAELHVDPELRSDAMMGLGSQVMGNERTGFLVSGAARIALSGARVAYNRGPGIYVQDSATATQLGYNWFQQNRGLAVGVTPTANIAEIVCNGISETLPALLRTDLGMLNVADGVSVAGTLTAGASGRVAVQQNMVRQNTRFGMLFTGPVNVMLQQNAGTVVNNGFPIGAYSGAVIQGTGYDPAAQPRTPPGRAEGF